MAIHFEHSIDVKAPPAKVFGVLDDFTQTPKWLATCAGIEKLTAGPNAAGTKLRYSYKQGGRPRVMDGEVRARIEDQRLTCHYADKMMDVVVDFQVNGSSGGTKLTHTIDITPKSFFARLFSPLIRRAVPKQTITAMDSLRSLVEGQQ